MNKPLTILLTLALCSCTTISKQDCFEAGYDCGIEETNHPEPGGCWFVKKLCGGE